MFHLRFIKGQPRKLFSRLNQWLSYQPHTSDAKKRYHNFTRAFPVWNSGSKPSPSPSRLWPLLQMAQSAPRLHRRKFWTG